jgi:hypothetical protein
VSPVKYEQGFYIPEDGILHSRRRENLESYISGVCHSQWVSGLCPLCGILNG